MSLFLVTLLADLWMTLWCSQHRCRRLNHSLVQVADDIFEDLVVVLGEAP